MNRILRAPLQWALGRRWAQPLFCRLHQLSLTGMNCGLGGDVETSGELNVIRRLQGLWKTSDPLVFFDVGANNGLYTEHLLKNFSEYPDLRIFAFEPSPVTFTVLEKCLADPIQKKRVTLMKMALSEKNGTQNLFSTGESATSGLTSLHERRLDHFNLQLKPEATVEVRTLDEICQEEGLHHIQFMKMDIEGHELSALRGAAGLLANGSIDVIQFEFGGGNIDSRTYWQDFFYLLKPHYNLYRVLRDGLWPMPSYQEKDEIFVTTNFLAVLPSYATALLRD